MQATVVERAAEAEDRARVYRFLAQAFAYPDAAGLRTLLEEDLPPAARAAEVFGEEIAAALSAAGHRLAHAEARTVAENFERIFTHVMSVDWPPYETAYTSKGVFQQANDLADIAGFCAAYGVEVSDTANEPPDHVSVELEFMHLLACKEAHALRNHTVEQADACREDARRFLGAHLARWVPEFSRRLRRGAAGTVYADFAEMCEAFVAQEVARLSAEVEPVDGAVWVEPPVSEGCVVPVETDAAGIEPRDDGSGGANA